MWIPSVREVDGYLGVLIRQPDMVSREAPVVLWPRDATAAEVATQLERLAAELRTYP